MVRVPCAQGQAVAVLIDGGLPFIVAKFWFTEFECF